MGKSIIHKFMDGEIPAPEAVKTLGAKITDINTDQGTITVEFQAKKAFLNPLGNFQGGFLAAMLDDTMGPALAATLPDNQFAPTLELKVNFIAAAKPGLIIGHGRIVSKGKSVCVLEGELVQDGRLVARGSATALIRTIA